MSDKAMMLYYDQQISIARYNKQYIRLLVCKFKKYLIERK